MQYSNKHLIEVNCSFQFPQETTPWDSTFFGRFYEKIYELGFSEKEERKGVQVTFGMQKNAMPIMPTTQIEDQVIFKNNKGYAILMSRNKISFHIINDYYTVWEDFLNNLIIPYSRFYKELKLGNGIRECQLVYLNRFMRKKTENLTDYFTIAPAHNKELGIEVNNIVQRVIDNGTNLLIAKFNSQLQNDNFIINLECGASSTDWAAKNNNDWIAQANATHQPVNDFFEKIITEKLRSSIK